MLPKGRPVSGSSPVCANVRNSATSCSREAVIAVPIERSWTR